MAIHALSMHTKDVYLNMNNIKNSAILQIVEFLFLQKNRTYIRKIKNIEIRVTQTAIRVKFIDNFL